MKRLSHVDRHGRARMVDISDKDETKREAVARGVITMRPETLRLIQQGSVPKGDVLAAARLAGVMAAKRVPDLIPLCHPLLLTSAEIEFTPMEESGRLDIESRVRITGRTGAEMPPRHRITGQDNGTDRGGDGGARCRGCGGPDCLRHV